jgi:hypothetical protein
MANEIMRAESKYIMQVGKFVHAMDFCQIVFIIPAVRLRHIVEAAPENLIAVIEAKLPELFSDDFPGISP